MVIPYIGQPPSWCSPVSDHDKLCILGQFVEICRKPAYIIVIQRRLDLVHHHEGGGPDLQNGEIQAMATNAFSPPESRVMIFSALPGGLHFDLDAAVEDVLRVLQLQRGLAAPEELCKVCPNAWSMVWNSRAKMVFISPVMSAMISSSSPLARWTSSLWSVR